MRSFNINNIKNETQDGYQLDGFQNQQLKKDIDITQNVREECQTCVPSLEVISK